MRIEKVYCHELNRNVDIYEAKLEYFKQEEPRKDFTFYCSDSKCREIKNPKIIGVLYNTHQNQETRRAPHFRKKDEHIETCMWNEITESIKELTKDEQSDEESSVNYNSKLKKTDIVEIFKYTKKEKNQERKDNKEKEKKLNDIAKIDSLELRKEAYKDLYSKSKISTPYLHKIVSSYHLLEERMLLEDVDLKIDKTIMKYREWFKHIRYYNENYQNRILYGGATVSKLENIGYTISFFDLNETNSESYSNKKLYLFIHNKNLQEYKYAAPILDILDESIEKRKWIKCFFIGDITINENKNLKAHVNDLDHLHIMFK